MKRKLLLLVCVCFLTATASPSYAASARASYDKAKKLMNEGKYEQAVPYLEKASKKDPHNRKYIRALMDAQESARENRHDRADELYKKAKSHIAKKEYLQAEDLLIEAKNLHPMLLYITKLGYIRGLLGQDNKDIDADYYAKKARKRFDAGELNAAESHIEKAIRLNPYNSTYKNLHADIKAAIKKQPSILVAKPAPPKKEKPVSVLAAKPAPPARKALPPNLGAYHALIIGNNNYQHLPKLKTAENDARAMASLLKSKYQFSVKLTLNATRANILKALTKYRRLMTDKDNLLIYYAGHGWLDNDADQGYWLPVDAANDDPTNWLSNASITSALRAIRAKHVMVVADSCYSGKLARGVHIRLKSSDYYTKILSKKARTVMASGGLEPVTDDGGKGKHSIFASALIEALNDNKDIIDATTLFSQIRRPVMLNSDQTPEYSDIRKAGHDGGDFVFVSRK